MLLVIACVLSLGMLTSAEAKPCYGCAGSYVTSDYENCDSCQTCGTYVKHATYKSPRMHVVNVPGKEQRRYYIYANVYGVKRAIPVINGQLPVISTNSQGNLILDYSYGYAYTVAYKSGVNYVRGHQVARRAANPNAPSAVKNYGQGAVKAHSGGTSALKYPEIKRAAKELPRSSNAVKRPSDREIESLLRP